MIRGTHEQDYVARWDRADAPPEWRRDRRYRGVALTRERLGPTRPLGFTSASNPRQRQFGVRFNY